MCFADAQTISLVTCNVESRREVMRTKMIPILLIMIAFAVPALGQTNTTYWFNKAMDLYNQDNISGSIDAYNNVLAIDPQDAQAWNNKGIDLGILGKYDDALQAFDMATSINSSYAEAWYNMGVVYDMQGDLDDAVHAYNKATIINPSYQKALISKNDDIDIIMSSGPNCGCNANPIPTSLAETSE
jgi:tetratricopeptide (TPR) repeat protein